MGAEVAIEGFCVGITQTKRPACVTESFPAGLQLLRLILTAGPFRPEEIRQPPVQRALHALASKRHPVQVGLEEPGPEGNICVT